MSATTGSPNGGEVDELDIASVHKVRVVHRFTFATCQPAGRSTGCGGPA